MTKPQPEHHARDESLFLLVGLAWVAALIHIQAAIEHRGVSTLHFVLFLALATAQFLWPAAVYRRATRGLLWAGAVVSGAAAAVWLISRTAGLPIGPTPGVPEPIGEFDVVATVDELLLAILVALQLRRVPSDSGRRVLFTAAKVGALVMIGVSSLTLVGGAEHGQPHP